MSWLDQFLYWKDSEDMSVEELMERLQSKREPTVQMRAGTALHKFLEDASLGEFHRAEVDGFQFTFQADIDLPAFAIRELKSEYIIQTHAGPVTLSGIVDAMDGRLVRDYKLTERFDAERYFESYQWRAYLMMFDARTFVYDIFTGRIDEGCVTVYGYDRLPLVAYPGMEREVARVTGDLAEIVARYWPERAAA